MFNSVLSFLSVKWIKYAVFGVLISSVGLAYNNWLNDRDKKIELQTRLESQEVIHGITIKQKDETIEAQQKQFELLLENSKAVKEEHKFKIERQESRRTVVQKAKKDKSVKSILNEKIPSNLTW